MRETGAAELLSRWLGQLIQSQTGPAPTGPFLCLSHGIEPCEGSLHHLARYPATARSLDQLRPDRFCDGYPKLRVLLGQQQTGHDKAGLGDDLQPRHLARHQHAEQLLRQRRVALPASGQRDRHRSVIRFGAGVAPKFPRCSEAASPAARPASERPLPRMPMSTAMIFVTCSSYQTQACLLRATSAAVRRCLMFASTARANEKQNE